MLLPKAMSCRILVVLVGLAAFSAGAAIAGEGEGWISNLDQAKKQAGESDRPIFIDFFATWCPPCKMLDSQTFSDQGVKKLLGEKFVTAKIDVDKDKTTSAAYSIRAMPTLIVTDAEGLEMIRSTGFMPPEPMKEFLNGVLTFVRARKAYAKDSKDTKALLAVATMICGDYTLGRDETLKVAGAALKVIPENDKQQRTKLLLVRGRAMATDQKTLDKAVQDFQTAARLDADNAMGMRETADWLILVTNFSRARDSAALTKSLKKFVADYPAGKIKNAKQRQQALIVLANVQARQKDFAGAIQSLETVKAEYAQSIDVAKVDEQIQQLRTVLERAAAAKKPEDSQKKTEGGQQDGKGSE
ncbi:MAG: thioredoxin fold domain-containing protein [Anaerolineaceae bacterium]|nr:thioredoxin fold domain-containing protein [Anaerolineaceae bacterium]